MKKAKKTAAELRAEAQSAHLAKNPARAEVLETLAAQTAEAERLRGPEIDGKVLSPIETAIFAAAFCNAKGSDQIRFVCAAERVVDFRRAWEALS